MNDSLTTYKIWAPDDALWTAWAKPVLFANTWTYVNFVLDIPESTQVFSEQDISGTMIILDLPGYTGVEEGLALAKNGFRPVPLYNGVNGPDPKTMIVNVRDIASALFQGASMLNSTYLPPNAPPVFLLDSNRMSGGGKEMGKYDNRWCVFPQDMPSAAFLSKHGIKKIIVRSHDNRIQNDLSHILCRYQEENIKIYLSDKNAEIDLSNLQETKVSKPSQFKSLIYRFKVLLGLTRNATGGFGGQIPDQTQSHGGYYRMG